uniref:p0648C09.8 protein n=1 Tax=Oryza sativa subsp. japonica TaxID=39947 RepID=Q8RYZ2_ORYSJ|nr:P0648C09.8 [Oryza sativa Japonica Group]
MAVKKINFDKLICGRTLVINGSTLHRSPRPIDKSDDTATRLLVPRLARRLYNICDRITCCFWWYDIVAVHAENDHVELREIRIILQRLDQQRLCIGFSWRRDTFSVSLPALEQR